MTGRTDPPEGPAPGGDDDEFRSTAFDESFVQAARLREHSAKERLDEHRPSVTEAESSHRRGTGPPSADRGRRRGVSGQFIGLLLVIVLAFGAAIYMGAGSPYEGTSQAAPQVPLRATVVPLMPRGAVPGADPSELFANSPAADFATGSDAVTLPTARATTHFTSSQVSTALATARRYVVDSSTRPEVLSGKSSEPVRALLNPNQHGDFDRSLRAPAADGRQEATGWMVRFHPEEARLADPRVRIHGTFTVSEAGAGALEVTAQHVLVYALRPAGADEENASLFTVRRQVRMRFTPHELRTGVLTLVQSTTQAGPLPCAEDTHDWMRPLLAGETAGEDGSAGTDPYNEDMRRTALCGVLARSAQPDLD